MWEFDISPANWKRSTLCEWDGVFTQSLNSLKIAIIIYRAIKNSAGLMLTNAIEDYLQRWSYIKIRQAKTKKKDDLFSCSVVTWVLLIVTDCHELLKNNTKFSKI